MKPASFFEPQRLPRHWEKRVLAAYLRMMGSTQADAGRAVGRCKRSIAEWEVDIVTWEQAREEARRRWLGALTDAARQTLLAVIQGGAGDLALKILERVDTDLAPPTQRLHHKHEIGAGLSSLLQAFGDEDANAG